MIAMKIAIVGYYGYNNFGDEINLLEMIKLIKAQYPKAEINVFSRALGFTFMQPEYNLVMGGGRSLEAFKQMLNSHDLIIIGGGGLIYFGAHYFTFLDEGIKAPYILSRLGVDDRAVNGDAVQKIKQMVQKASNVTVRTRGDLDLLQKHTGISCDVVPEAIWNYRIEPYKLPTTRKRVMVALNAYSGSFLDKLRTALVGIDPPVFEYTLAMQDTTLDSYYNVKATNQKNRKIVPDSIGLGGKGGCLAAADLTVTSRLHAALVSISHGVPAVMLRSTPKVKFLADELGLNDWYCEKELDTAFLEKMLSEKTAKQPVLTELTSKMRQRALMPIIP